MSLSGGSLILAAGLVITTSTPFPGYAVVASGGRAGLAVAGGTIAPGGGAEVGVASWLFQWIGKLSTPSTSGTGRSWLSLRSTGGRIWHWARR